MFGSLRNSLYWRQLAFKRRRAAKAHARSVASSLVRNQTELKNLARIKPVILIGLESHFGDIVACEPVARQLREQYPEAAIAWCVRRSFRELIDANPDIDITIPVECLTEWISLRDTPGMFRVIDLHVNGKFCPTCNVPLIKRDGDLSINIHNYYHSGNLLRAICLGAGVLPLDETPRIYLDERQRSTVDGLGLPERFVVVHVTSNEESRNWRYDNWNRLVRDLRDRFGLETIEVGLKPALDPATGVRAVCGRLTLLETAELIRRSQGFIGIDSGPAHLANAVGVPGIVLLGNYRNFGRYCPYSGGFADGSTGETLFHDGPIADLPYERVLDAVARRIMHKESSLEAKS